MIEELFADFGKHLKDKGYLAMGGQIVDATIVPVPVGWAQNPAKLAQKDRDARWTQKHGRSYYGYKDHVCIDRRHKLVSTIGIVRAKAKTGLRNLTYNMHRFTFREGAEALAA